jgi:predicted RNA-binding Zn-ribbon protein involved in translation (DUF1610 family)
VGFGGADTHRDESIRTNCPRCGEVEMRADVILLTVEPQSGEGTYSFVCPSCEDLVGSSDHHDIIDFHFLLHADDWLESLLASVE